MITRGSGTLTQALCRTLSLIKQFLILEQSTRARVLSSLFCWSNQAGSTIAEVPNAFSGHEAGIRRVCQTMRTAFQNEVLIEFQRVAYHVFLWFCRLLETASLASSFQKGFHLPMVPFATLKHSESFRKSRE